MVPRRKALEQDGWRPQLLNPAEGPAAGEPEKQPEDPAPEASDEWTTDIVQQLFALVNNKFGKGRKGKGGKYGKPKGKGEDGDVDMGAPSAPKGAKGSCYECGESGHYGRDCPQRAARVAAGGPAILDKKGKGGAGDGGKGWCPSAKDWKGHVPWSVTGHVARLVPCQEQG